VQFTVRVERLPEPLVQTLRKYGKVLGRRLNPQTSWNNGSTSFALQSEEIEEYENMSVDGRPFSSEDASSASYDQLLEAFNKDINNRNTPWLNGRLLCLGPGGIGPNVLIDARTDKYAFLAISKGIIDSILAAR